MRIVGPNATARATVRRAAAAGGFRREERRRGVAAGCVVAHHRRHRRPDRAARSGREAGAPASRGRPRQIALDALDELKVELLAGTLGPSTLMRLKSVSTDLLDASGDPRLDAVLAEIELRLAVEIAKLTPR